MRPDLCRDQFIGDYRLLEPIGAGGFSVVWKAVGPDGARVALKVPLDDAFVERLRHEADLAQRIDDPGVVPILAANLHADPPHLVMPFIDGRPLQAGLGCPEPRELEGALRAVLELARTVRRLHARGIAHGDIKPGNVLVDRTGRVWLVDLGLARLQIGCNLERSLAQSQVSVDGRSIAGTLDFMAPELFEGVAPSEATDLYALGVLLHELVTGRPPAFGVDPEERNPYLTPGLGPLLRALLHHDPDVRRRTGRRLVRRLERIVAAERRCNRRRNGHERRRIFVRRMATLRSGIAALAWLGVAVAGAAGVFASLSLLGWTGTSAASVAFGLFLLGAFPLGLLALTMGMTTINAWILGVPERDYKNRPGHPLWSFMMQ